MDKSSSEISKLCENGLDIEQIRLNAMPASYKTGFIVSIQNRPQANPPPGVVTDIFSHLAKLADIQSHLLIVWPKSQL
jgi:hypothetical protein